MTATQRRLERHPASAPPERDAWPASRWRCGCLTARPGWAAPGTPSSCPTARSSDDTVFAIASVSKTFIAALILELAEEGKLDLDVPFGRYWHGRAAQGCRHHPPAAQPHERHLRLLRASALLAISRAWLRPVSAPGLASREHVWTYDEIMDLVKTGYCKAGDCYHYSNTNYVILGRIAEAVGGAPLHEQLRQALLRAAGHDGHAVPAGGAAAGRMPPMGTGTMAAATRITRGMRACALRRRPLTVADAAGAIASTASDLSIWADCPLRRHGARSRVAGADDDDLSPDGSTVSARTSAVFAGHRAYRPPRRPARLRILDVVLPRRGRLDRAALQPGQLAHRRTHGEARGRPSSAGDR